MAAAVETVPAVAETVAAEIKFFLKKMRRRSGFLAESVKNQFVLKARRCNILSRVFAFLL